MENGPGDHPGPFSMLVSGGSDALLVGDGKHGRLTGLVLGRFQR